MSYTNETPTANPIDEATEALATRGVELARKGGDENYQQAVQCLEQAAQAGHSAAQCNLGYLVANGLGTVENAQRSRDLFEASAAQGNPHAQFNVAMLSMAEGTESSVQRAREMYETAAKKGHSDACYNLAILLSGENGDNGPRVRSLLEQSAEGGNIEARYSLGVCYSQGVGGGEDSTQAVFHYKLAADQGHMAALYNLGLHFYYGEGGLDSNREQARHCFHMAAAQGHEKARQAFLAIVHEMVRDGENVIEQGSREPALASVENT